MKRESGERDRKTKRQRDIEKIIFSQIRQMLLQYTENLSKVFL